jgi:hypothetical protein
MRENLAARSSHQGGQINEARRDKGRSDLHQYLRRDPASMRWLFLVRVRTNILALVPAAGAPVS